MKIEKTILKLVTRRSYRRLFRGTGNLSDARRVLLDLGKFTGAQSDLFALDPNQTSYNLGMRRVFLRIQGFLGEEIEMPALAEESEEMIDPFTD